MVVTTAERQDEALQPRRRYLAFAVPILVIAGTVLWLVRYDPLVHGNMEGGQFGNHHTASRSLSGDMEEVRPYFGRSERVFPFRRNADFTIVFTVQNKGRIPVRITEVVPALEESPMLRAMDVMMAVEGRGSFSWEDEMRPFAPVTLGRENYQLHLQIRYRFADCDGAAAVNQGTGADSQTLRYRVLGIPRTKELELRTPFVLADLPIGCPGIAE